ATYPLHESTRLSTTQRDGDNGSLTVKRVTKKIAPRLVTAVRELETDPAYGQLKEETRLKIKELMDRLSEAEKKDPPLAADNADSAPAADDDE
ncbi:hypothetical protein, partial [Burkholderia contaminans]|uniref:hypothetical protein n=1 Tax=Burkholderia contaminans TaxID=488447 RepID=UPI003F5B95CF